MVDITECRLTRQVRSASASPARRGRRKPDSAVLDFGAVLAWRLVTPSAKLMVDPRNGARAVIRDTGSDAGRYLWSVLGAGEMRPFRKVALTSWHEPSRLPRRASAPIPRTESHWQMVSTSMLRSRAGT